LGSGSGSGITVVNYYVSMCLGVLVLVRPRRGVRESVRRGDSAGAVGGVVVVVAVCLVAICSM